jgi:hypothetical protein
MAGGVTGKRSDPVSRATPHLLRSMLSLVGRSYDRLNEL